MSERLGLNGTILTYQDVADVLTAKTGVRVTRATVWRIVNGKGEPENKSQRRALGLPVTAPAVVCPTHGVVHPGRCPRLARKPKSLFDLPTAALAWMIRNRREYAPD